MPNPRYNKPRKPSFYDKQDAAVRAAMADAVIATMTPWLQLNRAKTLLSLSRDEIDTIADAVVSAFVLKRAEIADTLDDSATLNDLYAS